MIDNKGQASTLTFTAVDSQGKPGTGNVRVSSVAGSLASPTEVPLSQGGASASFSCVAAQDPACLSAIRLLGEWVSDGVRVETFGLVIVDGGTQ